MKLAHVSWVQTNCMLQQRLCLGDFQTIVSLCAVLDQSDAMLNEMYAAAQKIGTALSEFLGGKYCIVQAAENGFVGLTSCDICHLQILVLSN